MLAEKSGGYYQLTEEGEKSSKYIFVPGLADKYKSLYKFGASVAELREHVIEGEYEDIFQPEETPNDELDDEQKSAYLYELEQQKMEQEKYDPNNTEATVEFCQKGKI